MCRSVLMDPLGDHAILEIVRRRIARNDPKIAWVSSGAPIAEMLLRDRFSARGGIWCGVLLLCSALGWVASRSFVRSPRARVLFFLLDIGSLGLLLGISPVVIGLSRGDRLGWTVAVSVQAYAAIVGALVLAGDRRWHFWRQALTLMPLLVYSAAQQIWAIVLVIILLAITIFLFHEVGTRSVVEGLRSSIANEFLVRELEIANERLSHESTHDGLTGLGNRAHFNTNLEAAFANPDDVPVIVSFIDIDRFKSINDTFGHEVGDAVLVEVADRLQRFCSDSAVSARRSGDEFTVLWTSRTQAMTESEMARDLHRAIAGPFKRGRARLDISCSVGSALRQYDDSTSSLLRHADEALYEAKRRGRGCGVGYGEFQAASRSGVKVPHST